MRCLSAKRRDGFTFVEIMFAVTISSMVGAGMVALMISMARTNQSAHSQLLMRQEATRITARIEGLVRHGSRDAGLWLQDLEGVDDFDSRRIRFTRSSGISSSTLTMEIAFDPDTERLTVDQDVNDAANALEVLSSPPAGVANYRPHVADVLFSIPRDPNAANRSLSMGVTMELTLTDRGNTDRARLGPGNARTLTIVRNLVLRAP